MAGRAALRAASTAANHAAADRTTALWLWSVAALVLAMIVVGGATRLTDSGLSITEWKPILGGIPPLSLADWQAVFAKYQQIPEYHLVNKGMTLEAFKTIYWWEWGHRFLGRFIGVAFALPLAWLWATGRLRASLKARLVSILALGGLQGAVGWYMVASGLVDRVDVSQYRLALHLVIAFVILGAIVWTALDLALPELGDRARADIGSGMAVALVALILVQVVLGAFVAGMKAGLAYNTWPLMDGALIPSGLWVMQPWVLNLFENAATVQFDHRIAAYLLLILAGWHVVQLRGGPHAGSAIAVLAGLVIQAGLGIATLLAHVPLWLGLLHQGGAAVVFALAVWHAHALFSGVAAARLPPRH